MDLRKIIEESFSEALIQTDSKLKVESIEDDMVLLESGLDSLGFAILIVILEEKLDVDPFTEMEDPIYPVTFKEFFEIYENFLKKN